MRTKDEVIELMTDVIPYEFNPHLKPYVKELMDIYAKEQMTNFLQWFLDNESKIEGDPSVNDFVNEFIKEKSTKEYLKICTDFAAEITKNN